MENMHHVTSHMKEQMDKQITKTKDIKRGVE